MKKKITIYDISERLNISAATVSRALNNHPSINFNTKELVNKVAKELGYKQNALARALKSGRTKTIGIIVPYINSNFFSSVIHGIEEELSAEGYHVIICQSHDTLVAEKTHLLTLLNAQVDGVFMSLSKETDDVKHIEDALHTNTPIILFDRKKEVKGVSSIVIDDYQGGYLATEHLIQQGCKLIAHFSGDQRLEIYLNRKEGYLKALKDYNLPVIEDLIIPAQSSVNAGIEATKKLLKMKKKPDAIFSSSDYAALGSCQELRRNGFQIPNDVAIIGFSNEPFTQYMELSISSVDQTPNSMGKMCGQVFLETMNDNFPGVSIEKKVVLAPQLLIRKSSAKK